MQVAGIGKTVNQLENETTNQGNTNTNTNNQITTNTTNTTNQTNKNNINITNKKLTTNDNQVNNSNAVATSSDNQNDGNSKELNFVKPVDGEIIREYAKENLIYSPTLEEWTTHTGIDIRADKTTVVKASEAGTIKSIKNDPRYGLTVVIEHENGYQTIYSNLLTSEFVVEGEKVEKEQSIGTVGNTAVFEISDEPHLHFEIIKDNLPIDPSLYIK